MTKRIKVEGIVEKVNIPVVKTPKEKVIKTKKDVVLVSYSMKMTIPTGQYANIIPEILVKAGTVEDAHDFIAPHMNKLWKEYFMINERPRPTEKMTVTPTPSDISVTVPKTAMDSGTTTINEVKSPVESVALTKATQAVNSCVSKEALDMIKTQIDKSVKLNSGDKSALLKLVETKSTELNGK